jgi:hypothetical protein
MKILCGFTCSAAVLSLLGAVAAPARDTASAQRAVLKVTLGATVTKRWNTVTHTTLNGCDVSISSIGVRKATLRSKRPTRVVITSRGGGVSYAPAAARLVTVEVTGSGEQTTTYEPPCQQPAEHVSCARAHRHVSGAVFRFFRSKRNELSFRHARLPAVSASCPSQSAILRTIVPGLHQAEGEISERALTNPRVARQTAIASADVETDLDEDEEGRVTERVRWTLTFSR